MASRPSFGEFIRFFWICVTPINRWIAGAYTVLGAITLCRDEFVPAPWRNYHVLDLLPNWPIYLWIAIGLVILVVFIGDGVFREKWLIAEAHQKSKPIFDVRGNPYGSSQKRGESKLIAPGVVVIIIVGAYFFGRAKNIRFNNQ